MSTSQKAVFKRRLIKLVALGQLIAFTTLSLQPLTVAAQVPTWLRDAHPRAAPAVAPKLQVGESASPIEAIQTLVKRSKAKRVAGQSSRDEIQQIIRQRQHLAFFERNAAAGLRSPVQAAAGAANIGRAEARMLRASEVITQRAGRLADLLNALQLASDAGNPDAMIATEEEIHKLLAGWNGRKLHSPTDFNHLPFRGPKEAVRVPAVGATKQAGLGKLSTTKSTGVPKAQDTSATLDAQLTPRVVALANTLHQNPREIYEWVKSNIRFVPTFASIQGSEETLVSRQGNAFDISSLLIALLRASGVPARYVHGTILLDAERAKSWVGGAVSAPAALSALSQGGIPSFGLVSGGQVQNIRLEHVWVEAFVNFAPSRGNLKSPGDLWVPMDAAFKRNVRRDAGVYRAIDTAPLIQQVSTLSQFNEAEGWATSNAGSLPALWVEETARDEVLRLVNANPDLVDEDLLAPVRPIAPQLQILPGSLDYPVESILSRWSEIPSAFRAKAKLEYFDSAVGRDSSSPALTYEVPLVQLAGKKFSVRFAPATDEDAALIQNSVSSGASLVPAYQIDLVPKLSVDDVAVATGPVGTMGGEAFWSIELTLPTKQLGIASFTGTVGDEIVFGINGGGVTQGSRDAALAKHAAVTASNTLFAVATQYWYLYDAQDEILAASFGTVSHRMPSVGAFFQRFVPEYAFGVPVRGSYLGRSMDVKLALRTEASLASAQRSRFYFTSGLLSSYLEGATFDFLFGQPVGTGRSAVHLLRVAAASGQRIYLVNGVNVTQATQSIDADPSIISEITNAVAAGKVVYIHQNPVQEGNWQGHGYIVVDPATGWGAFSINGETNGGDQGASCPLTPVAQPSGLPVNSLVIGIFVVMGLVAAAAMAPGVIALLAALLIPPAAMANVPMVQIGQLSTAQAEVWQAFSGGQPFPASAAKEMPQTCGNDVKNQLYGNQRQACSGVRECLPGMDCNELRDQRQKRFDCMEARLQVMTQCFGGGDAGHWVNIKNHLGGVVKCNSCLAQQEAGGQCQ